MSVLFAMLLGREFPMLYTNRLVHECESVHESESLSYCEVATSLVNPSLLSHSRFSANPDGRIVLLYSALPRFEPVDRGSTLSFHIPALGGQGLCRSVSGLVPFVKFLLTIFSVRVHF